MTTPGHILWEIPAIIDGVTITTNPVPIVSISRVADGAEENQQAMRFALTRNSTNLSQALSVTVEVSSNETTAQGGDYTLTQPAAFAPGVATVYFDVPVTDDSTPEWTEKLTLRIKSSINYCIGTRSAISRNDR